MGMRRKTKQVSASRDYVMGKAEIVSAAKGSPMEPSVLDALTSEMRAGFETMREGFATMRNEMRTGFAGSDRKSAALRSEMKAGFTRIGVALDKRPTREELEPKFASIDVKFDRVFTALDRLTGEAYDAREARTSFGEMHRRHREALDSHDRRLGALESRLPPPTP